VHSHLGLEERLKIEALRRTNNGSLPQILVAFLGWALIPRHHENIGIFIIGFLFVILLQTGRSLWIRKYRLDFDRLLKSFPFLMSLSAATALSWSLLAALVYREFGLASPQGIYFSFNLFSYIAGCTYSLASVPRLQKIFFWLVSWPLLVAAIYEHSSFSWASGVIFCVFLIYLYGISKNHADDLRHTYETEANLRSEREKLQKIINSVPGFVTCSDEKGKWIEVSDSAKNILEIQEFQAEQKKFRDSKAEMHVQEVDWSSESGTENSYVISFARLREPPDSVVAVGVPINELKSIRHEMEMQRSKVEYSARLSTIGEMAGGIAHEVNNPLAIIVGASFQLRNFLTQTVPDPGKGLDYLHKIDETANRISDIIRSLQYFARQGDDIPFEPTHVPIIIENTLKLCRQKFAQGHVDLQVDAVPEVNIPVKSAQIAQVLINLLNNAYDAVLKAPVKKVQLKFSQDKEGLTFSISDTGPGISDKAIEHIFEPFFTTKEIGKGTGLGLSVSKGIIEAHKGQMSVQTSSAGTTVSFSLPWKQSKLQTSS
jgi:signal transduction histidine kinase